MAARKKAASKKKTTTRRAGKAAAPNPGTGDALAEAEAKAKVAAAKKAEQDARKAKQEAEKAKIRAEKQKIKEQRLKELERFQDATKKDLEKVAKNANARIDAIARAEKKTDDQRLALAIYLAEAKEKCKDAKLNYKDWAEEHLKYSYENVRKLLPVGDAERNEEGTGLKLLEDMREKNRAANKKLRDKKNEESGSQDGGKQDGDDKPEAPSVTPDKIREQMADLDKMSWEKVMSQEAKANGQALVDEADAEDIKRGPMDRAKASFERLSSKAKLEFFEWVKNEVGAADEDGEDE